MKPFLLPEAAGDTYQAPFPFTGKVATRKTVLSGRVGHTNAETSHSENWPGSDW
jgi:hypothetical protein